MGIARGLALTLLSSCCASKLSGLAPFRNATTSSSVRFFFSFRALFCTKESRTREGVQLCVHLNDALVIYWIGFGVTRALLSAGSATRGEIVLGFLLGNI